MNFYFQALIIETKKVELIKQLDWNPDTMELLWVHLNNGSMIKPDKVKLKIITQKP